MVKRNLEFWDNDNQIIAVAHRGGDGAGIEKENSLPAFKSAYNLGYRWLETDVVPTKDNRLLAIHGRGFQLKPNKDLPTRIKIHCLNHEQALKTIKVGGEPPILLDDLLDTFPDVKFFIDPKTPKAALLLANTLKKRQDLSRICVASFVLGNTKRVRRALHDASHTDQKIKIGGLGPLYAGSLRIVALLPILRPIFVAHIKRADITSLHLPYRWLKGKRSSSLINLAHTLNLKVAVYTPNTDRNICAMLNNKVDAIMSDKITLLSELVKTNRHKRI